MIRFRFLQLSDLHVGSAMTGSRLKLPPDKREIRLAEFDAMIRNIPRWVKAHQAQAVLMPGDLWDYETLEGEAITAFRTLYNVLCNLTVPVVITPGNHDFYSPGSFYHPQRLAIAGFAPWPDHIVIFDNPTFQTRWLPGYENQISITGKAFHDNPPISSQAASQRALSGLQPLAPDHVLSLLLFHGSRDDANRFDDKLTAPFSRQELLTLGFDYTAIGHYHRHDVFRDDAGKIRGAYSGSPFARGLDETGERVVLAGEALKAGASPADVTLEPIPSDPRRIVSLNLDITGQETVETLSAQVLADLSQLAREQDLVHCDLSGRIPAGLTVDWDHLETLLSLSFFHLKLNPRGIVPAYDLDDLRARPDTLEGRFILEMEQRIGIAQTENEKTVLEKALYLGLDALTASAGRRLP